MNNIPTVEELKHLPQGSSFYISFKSLCIWGGSILLAMLIIGGLVAHFVVGERETVAKEDIQRRVEILAQSKADVIHTWLKGVESKSAGLVESEATKLFVTEMANHLKKGGDEELPRALKAQKGYYKNVLASHVEQSHLSRAAFIANTGEVIVDAGEQKLLNDTQQQALKEALKSKKTTFAPVLVSGGKLILNVFQPVFDMGGELDRNTSGVLMSSAIVTNQLLNFMSGGPLSLAGERTSFTQMRNNMLEMVEVNADQSRSYGIRNDFLAGILAGKRTQYEFSPFVSPIDQSYVFGASAYIIGTPFNILQEFNEREALSSVKAFARNVYAIMLLVILLVSALFFAVVAYLVGSRNRHRVQHQTQTINALVRAVEIRDPYLRGHHERVARLSLSIANKMRLNVAERSTVYYAAMLSGVGKIFVPQKIMLKPSRLTQPEQEIMRSHVSHAVKVFEGIDFDFPIAEVIGEMHERMDGTGYPQGKRGAQINLLSRIVAVCDVYCALTKPRAYREALTSAQAIEEMREPSSGLDKGVLGVLESVVVAEK